MMCLSVNR